MRIAGLICGMLVTSVAPAAGQIAWTDKVFINASGGLQLGTRTTESTLSQVIYDETATIRISGEIGSSFLIDVTAGAKIRGNFGVAGSFTRRSVTSEGSVSASIPDPVFFDRPRTVNSSIAELSNSEQWIGALATVFVPVGEKLDMLLLFGPAVVTVKRDAAVSATITEAGLSPSVTLRVDSASRTFWGFQATADFRYMFTERVGVGGFGRFSRATGSLAGADIEVGGLQFGGGLRLRW